MAGMSITRVWLDEIARVPVLAGCPRCGTPPGCPEDAEDGYCGVCHWWTGDPVLGQLEPPPASPRVVLEVDAAGRLGWAPQPVR